jgi:hypothetical protein
MIELESFIDFSAQKFPRNPISRDISNAGQAKSAIARFIFRGYP